MSSTVELQELERRVGELEDTVRGFGLKLDAVGTLEPRIQALEATSRAHGTQLAHLEKVVLAIQVEVQKLSKSWAQESAKQAQKLDDIHGMQQRLLDLLQPKAVL